MSSLPPSNFQPQSGKPVPGAPVLHAYVIEVGETAAGVLVRDRDAFRFFAAHRDFSLLEGGIFRTPRAAQQAAERMQAAARPAR